MCCSKGPFRLRLHELHVVFKGSDCAVETPPKDLCFEKVVVGQMMAYVFPAYAAYERLGKELPAQ